jgi:hypothetical protein
MRGEPVNRIIRLAVEVARQAGCPAFTVGIEATFPLCMIESMPPSTGIHPESGLRWAIAHRSEVDDWVSGSPCKLVGAASAGRTGVGFPAVTVCASHHWLREESQSRFHVSHGRGVCP